MCALNLNSARILTLLHPAGTIMDLNIGAALWLAVGARGKLRRPVSWCMPKQPSGGASDAAASAAPEAAASAVSTITTASAASAASGGGFAKAEEAIGSSSMKSSPCCQGGGADPGTAAGKESLEGWQLGNPGGIAGDDEGGDVAAGARYRSSARVVLLGHGADEQCAGYGRHRTSVVALGAIIRGVCVCVCVSFLWPDFLTLAFEGIFCANGQCGGSGRHHTRGVAHTSQAHKTGQATICNSCLGFPVSSQKLERQCTAYKLHRILGDSAQPVHEHRSMKYPKQTSWNTIKHLWHVGCFSYRILAWKV
eukprot:scaffold288729_cov19-Tisochrysis_lutea.AAC.2